MQQAKQRVRVEMCPYCELPMPVVGIRTEFEHCPKPECRDKHIWATRYGITHFPPAIPTRRKEQRAMRRLMLND